MKPWAVSLSKRVKAFVEAHDYNVVDRLKKSDYTICVGGDGTIMYYNYLGLLSGKIIGIGGKQSAVAQISNTNWEDILSLLKYGKCQRLSLLDVRMGRRKLTAVNDVVLHSKSFRVVNFNLVIGTQKFEFLADGVIMSTPLGSTAYSYSAGGDILPLKSKKNIIVAVAPYLRAFEPFQTNKAVKISAGEKCAVLVDGILLGESKSLSIEKGKSWCYLVL